MELAECFPELTVHMHARKLGQRNYFNFAMLRSFLMYHTKLVTLWKSMRPEKSSSHKNQEA